MLDAVKINSEVGSLCGECQGGKMFRFMRYDVKLETDWLRESSTSRSRRRTPSATAHGQPAIVNEIYEIAKLAAQKQVKPEHCSATCRVRHGAGGTQRGRVEPLTNQRA